MLLIIKAEGKALKSLDLKLFDQFLEKRFFSFVNDGPRYVVNF